MIPDTNAPFDGVYVATVCPMRPDFAIDEDALAAHLQDAMATPGMRGVLINGHAGENFMLSREEKRRVVAIAHATIGDRAVIVSGLNAEGSLEAQRHAADARDAGADALMVFPPFSWALSQDADMAVTHHRMIAEAAPGPLMLYQAGVRAGTMAYTHDALARLVQIPGVVGIKEGSWEAAAYEANRRLVKAVAPQVSVMASGDEHLLTCFVVGSEGSLVSLAVLVPDAIVGLERAVLAGDLERARGHHSVIQPLARAIYGTAPGGLATARLKCCLKMVGKLRHDVMRPPIGPLPDHEVAMLRSALTTAGLL
ncbi:dihydrodipicolinate synthase family protein [Azospirillum sp. RWY-5-1]|uniref:Dihydrodipicolinate synthase family protein n=1 Tax=Azospirillum oleiclasticum TaxID=2735135 RepID=A0ABX2TI53_9PROT|nr:dihydrodipicolinate synthase family protein [Azospirillum oleiclasticum]NYZ16516.1 dihydrodipicolinate synthase family protein [Azospirillum oleiclasticum]NYZ24015.1 dihydrodipicolinate synthase family protein [Azospirillum oleiclasticum]